MRDEAGAGILAAQSAHCEEKGARAGGFTTSPSSQDDPASRAITVRDAICKSRPNRQDRYFCIIFVVEDVVIARRKGRIRKFQQTLLVLWEVCTKQWFGL
jgi:hypothetical protein